MSLTHHHPDCTGRWEPHLIDELEHEIDANLARYRGLPDEPCLFSLAVLPHQMTAVMRQILADRYENAGWSRAWFEEVSEDELLFVLEPSARQRQVLDGSWFGRLSPPPPPAPWWYDWPHRAAIPLLWGAVVFLWIVALSISTPVTR